MTLTPGSNARAASVLPYLETAVLGGFLWQFCSPSLILPTLHLSNLPLFLSHLECICRNVSPPQGQTLSFPMEPGPSRSTHGRRLILLPLPVHPGILSTLLSKEGKADRLPATSTILLKHICSIYLCSPWDIFRIFIAPVFCYLCRGVFQHVPPVGIHGRLKAG